MHLVFGYLNTFRSWKQDLAEYHRPARYARVRAPVRNTLDTKEKI